jgi:hypothetical protein
MFARTIAEIGGSELLEITRVGAVDGINQDYLPLTGLADTNMDNDPLKIIALQNTDEQYFKQFSVSLNRYIPDEGTGENGEIVYIDSDRTSSTYSSLIINTLNLRPEERLEIEFISFQDILNDTIIET